MAEKNMSCGRTDPYRGPWHIGMVAGKIGGLIRGMLARSSDRGSSSYLPLYRERSRRGGSGQTAHWRHHLGTYPACPQTKRNARQIGASGKSIG